MRVKGYNVTPIHFNHKLRPQNDLMEQRYKLLCDATGAIPIVSYGNNLKTEKDCRQARLNFYQSLNGKILTAHHLNDCVESHILNFLRGNSHHQPFNLISNFNGFQILHPFLITKKSDFIQYADRNNLNQFIINDETNFQNKGSRRNWIRNSLIPNMIQNHINLEKSVLKQIQDLIKN